MACCKTVLEVSNLLSFVDTRLKCAVSSDGNIPYFLYIILFKSAMKGLKMVVHLNITLNSNKSTGHRHSDDKKKSTCACCKMTQHSADAGPV